MTTTTISRHSQVAALAEARDHRIGEGIYTINIIIIIITIT